MQELHAVLLPKWFTASRHAKLTSKIMLQNFIAYMKCEHAKHIRPSDSQLRFTNSKWKLKQASSVCLKQLFWTYFITGIDYRYMVLRTDSFEYLCHVATFHFCHPAVLTANLTRYALMLRTLIFTVSVWTTFNRNQSILLFHSCTKWHPVK